VQFFLEHAVDTAVDTYLLLSCRVSVVDKLLSLETRSNANFTFTRQRMHNDAKLSNDDIM